MGVMQELVVIGVLKVRPKTSLDPVGRSPTLVEIGIGVAE